MLKRAPGFTIAAVLLSVSSGLILVGGLACFLPALRAMGV